MSHTTSRDSKSAEASVSGISPTEFCGTFFALSVANAKDVAEWYCKHLGFRTLIERDLPEHKIVGMVLERERSLIEIIQRDGTQPPPEDANGKRGAFNLYGIFKIGFAVTDLQILHDRLEAEQVAFEFHILQPAGNPWRTFGVRDPEGNIVQFFG